MGGTLMNNRGNMTISKAMTCVASVCAVLALSGCGSDGGGAVSSVSGTSTATGSTPPTPVPVTPAGLSASTSFSPTMQSGTFVSIPSTPGAYVSYNATSNTYTLISGSTTDTMAPGTADPTESTRLQQISGTANSGTVNYLLTHTGNNAFVYSYTAVASVHSVISSIVPVATNVGDDVAVFGMPTPASAVPRTGNATYALDVLGYYKGTGTGTVNFASGTYNFSGTLAQGNVSGTFSSNGTLANSNNGFSGGVNVSLNQGAATFNGSLGGLFFGPAAQELGATFVASPTTSNGTLGTNISANPIVGAILGHR
jgi:hypothetical protein